MKSIVKNLIFSLLIIAPGLHCAALTTRATQTETEDQAKKRMALESKISAEREQKSELAEKKAKANLETASYILFKKKSLQFDKDGLHETCFGLPKDLAHEIFLFTDIKKCTSLQLNEHHDRIEAMVTYVSPEETPKIASGSDDCTIRIWDAHSGICEKTIILGEQIKKLTTYRNSDKKIQLAAASKSILYLCDLNSGRCKQRISIAAENISPENPTLCSYTAKDGHARIAIGASDCKIYIWNPDTCVFEHILSGHSNKIISLSAFRNENGTVMLASGGMDGRVCIWDTQRGKLNSSDGSHGINGSYLHIFVPKDGIPRIVSIGTNRDSAICIWNTQTRTYESIIFEGNRLLIRHLAHFKGADGVIRIVATFAAKKSGTPTICIWNAETGVCESLIEDVSCGHDPLTFTDSDGTVKLAYASYEKDALCIWNPQLKQIERRLEGHSGGITSIRQCGKTTLATSSFDGTIRIWKNETVGLAPLTPQDTSSSCVIL